MRSEVNQLQNQAHLSVNVRSGTDEKQNFISRMMVLRFGIATRPRITDTIIAYGDSGHNSQEPSIRHPTQSEV